MGLVTRPIVSPCAGLFGQSSACRTSFLSSTANGRSTARVASRGPGSMYSPRMRLASSTARISVSWSGLFITARLNRIGIQDWDGILVPPWRCNFMSRRLSSSRALCPQAASDSLSPARFRPDVRPCKATSGRSFPLAHSETEFNGIGGLLTYIGDGPHLSNRRR